MHKSMYWTFGSVMTLLFCLQDSLVAQQAIRLKPAEEFVLRRIKAGDDANLAEFSSRPDDRALGHEFLEKLLAGGYGSSGEAVKIEHAIVKDTLNAPDENIPFAVWLTDCEFRSGVDFSDANFTNGLSLESSTFGSPEGSSNNAASGATEGEALFIGMRVSGTTVFNGAKFYIPLDFTYAQIGGQFLFDDVIFQAKGYADFNGITTRAPAFFRHDHFAGPVALTDASFFELFLEDITFDLSNFDPQVPELSLDNTRINRDFSVKNTKFRSIQAQYLEVAGPANLDDITVSKHLSLAHSKFQALTVKDLSKWQDAQTLDIDFEGISFEGVDVPEDKVEDYASKMLDLINSQHNRYYSPQPYLVLEKFLRSHGNPEKADEVYISMRRRERKEIECWKRPEDWFLDVLVGYGRKPWRAVFYLLGLALIGIFVFRKDVMQLQDAKRQETRYSPFWYSLDTLAPVIDLSQAKLWEPRPENGWVRNYAQCQRIAGWILVPLILAAITGIIK